MFEGCSDKKYKAVLSCKTCQTGLNKTFFTFHTITQTSVFALAFLELNLGENIYMACYKHDINLVYGRLILRRFWM